MGSRGIRGATNASSRKNASSGSTGFRPSSGLHSSNGGSSKSSKGMSSDSSGLQELLTNVKAGAKVDKNKINKSLLTLLKNQVKVTEDFSKAMKEKMGKKDKKIHDLESEMAGLQQRINNLDRTERSRESERRKLRDRRVTELEAELIKVRRKLEREERQNSPSRLHSITEERSSMRHNVMVFVIAVLALLNISLFAVFNPNFSRFVGMESSSIVKRARSAMGLSNTSLLARLARAEAEKAQLAHNLTEVQQQASQCLDELAVMKMPGECCAERDRLRGDLRAQKQDCRHEVAMAVDLETSRLRDRLNEQQLRERIIKEEFRDRYDFNAGTPSGNVGAVQCSICQHLLGVTRNESYACAESLKIAREEARQLAQLHGGHPQASNPKLEELQPQSSYRPNCEALMEGAERTIADLRRSMAEIRRNTSDYSHTKAELEQLQVDHATLQRSSLALQRNLTASAAYIAEYDNMKKDLGACLNFTSTLNSQIAQKTKLVEEKNAQLIDQGTKIATLGSQLSERASEVARLTAASQEPAQAEYANEFGSLQQKLQDLMNFDTGVIASLLNHMNLCENEVQVVSLSRDLNNTELLNCQAKTSLCETNLQTALALVESKDAERRRVENELLAISDVKIKYDDCNVHLETTQSSLHKVQHQFEISKQNWVIQSEQVVKKETSLLQQEVKKHGKAQLLLEVAFTECENQLEQLNLSFDRLQAEVNELSAGREEMENMRKEAGANLTRCEAAIKSQEAKLVQYENLKDRSNTLLTELQECQQDVAAEKLYSATCANKTDLIMCTQDLQNCNVELQESNEAHNKLQATQADCAAELNQCHAARGEDTDAKKQEISALSQSCDEKLQRLQTSLQSREAENAQEQNKLLLRSSEDLKLCQERESKMALTQSNCAYELKACLNQQMHDPSRPTEIPGTSDCARELAECRRSEHLARESNPELCESRLKLCEQEYEHEKHKNRNDGRNLLSEDSSAPSRDLSGCTARLDTFKATVERLVLLEAGARKAYYDRLQNKTLEQAACLEQVASLQEFIGENQHNNTALARRVQICEEELTAAAAGNSKVNQECEMQLAQLRINFENMQQPAQAGDDTEQIRHELLAARQKEVQYLDQISKFDAQVRELPVLEEKIVSLEAQVASQLQALREAEDQLTALEERGALKDFASTNNEEREVEDAARVVELTKAQVLRFVSMHVHVCINMVFLGHPIPPPPPPSKYHMKKNFADPSHACLRMRWLC